LRTRPETEEASSGDDLTSLSESEEDLERGRSDGNVFSRFIASIFSGQGGWAFRYASFWRAPVGTTANAAFRSAEFSGGRARTVSRAAARTSRSAKASSDDAAHRFERDARAARLKQVAKSPETILHPRPHLRNQTQTGVRNARSGSNVDDLPRERSRVFSESSEVAVARGETSPVRAATLANAHRRSQDPPSSFVPAHERSSSEEGSFDARDRAAASDESDSSAETRLTLLTPTRMERAGASRDERSSRRVPSLGRARESAQFESLSLRQKARLERNT